MLEYRFTRKNYLWFKWLDKTLIHLSSRNSETKCNDTIKQSNNTFKQCNNTIKQCNNTFKQYKLIVERRNACLHVHLEKRMKNHSLNRTIHSTLYVERVRPKVVLVTGTYTLEKATKSRYVNSYALCDVSIQS